MKKSIWRSYLKWYNKNMIAKKALMVIAFRDFRDEEYFTPKGILENEGIEVKTASNKKGLPAACLPDRQGRQGIAIGADGGEAEVDLLVSEVYPVRNSPPQVPSGAQSAGAISNGVNPSDFDAVVFVGGPGCLKSLDNEESYNLAKETIAKNKILAAICISPVILARAGVLRGKKATVWTNSMDKSAIKILEQNGAIYQNKTVVVDGKIITADGPISAKEFGERIVGLLTSKD